MIARLRPRVHAADLAREALAGVASRPGRAILTALGTVLGIAALVATAGLSQTAGAQIVGRFDALAATEVRAEPASEGISLGGAQAATSSLPFDAPERVLRLNGVVAAGCLSDVDVGGDLASGVAVRAASGAGALPLPVKAASPGLFPAVRAVLRSGRVFDDGHSDRADRVAVLGPGAAARLGIARLDRQPAVFLGDRLFVVLGVLDDVARQPDLLDAVIIPEGTARKRYGLQAPDLVEIDTAVGAAPLVARQVATVLDPNDPASVQVSSAPEPRRVKGSVQSDVDGLFLVLGSLSLLIGAIGIANVTLVSVLERVGEIGLRRALGAARRHVAGQFLAEAVLLGGLGGVVGTSAGVLVVVGVSATKTWTPVLPGGLAVAAPLLGAAVGLLAGLYPAWRAARLEPVEALRAGL